MSKPSIGRGRRKGHCCVWLSSGADVEISFALVAWASIATLDAGTRRVITDGCRILHHPARFLERLYEAVQSPLYPCTTDAPVAVVQPLPVFDGRGVVCREVLESLIGRSLEAET